MKGFIPLAHIYHLVRKEIEKGRPKPEYTPEQIDFYFSAPDSQTQEMDMELSQATAEWERSVHDNAIFYSVVVCRSMSQVYVMNINGKTLLASKQLLEGESISTTVWRHVDLLCGTVGSGQDARNLDHTTAAVELAVKYGPFLGLPIVFDEREYDSIKWGLRMDETEARDDKAFGYSVAEVAGRIVAAVNRGEVLTKARVRTRSHFIARTRRLRRERWLRGILSGICRSVWRHASSPSDART